jgi:hypothetical protein
MDVLKMRLFLGLVLCVGTMMNALDAR